MFHVTFEKAAVGMAHVGIDGNWIHVNEQLCNFLGYTKDELLSKTFKEITYIDDIEYDLKNVQELYDGKKDSFNIEKRYIKKDGNPVWSDLTATAIRDEYGKIKYFIAVIKDIDDYKKSQIAVKDERQKYKTIMELASDGVHIIDENGNIVEFSHSFADMLGYSDDEMKTLNVTDWDAVKEKEELLNTVRSQLLFPDRFYAKLKRKDGSIIDAQITSNGIELDGKRYLYASARDITEQKRIESEIKKAELKFFTIFQESLDGIVLVNLDTQTFLEFNKKAFEMYGYTKEEFEKVTVKDLEILQDENEIKTRQANMVQRGWDAFVTKHKTKDGTIKDISVNVVKIILDEKPYLYATFHDITKEKEQQKLIEDQKNEFETIFRSSKDGIAVLDMESNFLDFNEAYLKMTGFTHEELLTKSCLSLSAPEDKEHTIEAMNTVVKIGFLVGFEKMCIVKDGRRLAINMTATVLPDKKRTLITTKDITENKEHEQQLVHIAHYDMLTGLPNRVLNSDRLRQDMLQARRRNEKIAVLYLDLDGFKEVNDRYGHSVGDKLLIALSSSMKQALREGDTLSRLGGDEFVVILVDVNDTSIALPIIQRLLDVASKTIHLDDITVQVSVSIGITFYPQYVEVDADQLIRQADQAMYEAKQSGKNRYHIFDSENDRTIRTRHEKLDRIRQALVNNEFVLYYQPKVNMRAGALIGAEALIRWRHPEEGLLPPLEFLPVIENHPLAVEVGEWVINEAVSQIERWQELGLNLPVSVNVGAKQLLQGDFVERLQLILAKHESFDSSLLEIEILETSALEDVNQASQIIEVCKILGIHFALDDFGTGYSSLTYLKQLPVETLKIDQSFVRNMLDDRDDLAILKGIVGLASAFDRKVIAEGVETYEHSQQLLLLGCELVQGYGIARPMPSEKMIEWSQKWEKDHIWLD